MPVETPALAPPPLNCRVLLAEDDDASALYAEAALRICGCDVVRVTDGCRALAGARQGGIDVLLLDVHMPGVDGLEVARALRSAAEQDESKRIPIVMVTASVFEDEVRSCFAAGADEVLAKPFKVEQLWFCLARWVSKRQRPQRSEAASSGSQE